MTASGPRLPGWLPLVAALAGAGACEVLLLAGVGSSVVTAAAGPVTALAAVLGCRQIARSPLVDPAAAAFWGRLGVTAGFLVLASTDGVLFAAHRGAVSPFAAVPVLLAVLTAMLAFLKLPYGRRRREDWARLVLDGATVAVAGGLIFTYVLGTHLVPGLDRPTAIGTAGVGVGALIAVVVIGRAAMTPGLVIDPVAMRLLTLAPLAGVIPSVLMLVTGSAGRMAANLLAVPLAATAITIAAYRQFRVLGRPEAAPAAPGRDLYRLLPFLAVVVTGVMVVGVSARPMDADQRAVIIGAVLIAAFVVLRQLVGLRESGQLLRRLRRQQAHLEELALRDPLTGLANRARFSAMLDERLAAGRPTAVVLLDADDFKLINDTLGHDVGDDLLSAVALRLRRHAAGPAGPARMGGDEFAVLVDTGDPAVAEQAAAKLVTAFGVPYPIGEHRLMLHVSAGVAVAGPGETAGDVLRNADIAMYEAKDAGKSGWARFEPRMRQEVLDFARVGTALLHAIEHDELFVVYQPVWDVTTGRMSGAEALVRWRHPERGLISPAAFVPVAERTGLIVPLGAFVLRAACAQLAAWQAEHGSAAIRTVNVNVAGRQLREADFVQRVADVLAETGLTPANLVLEVTESTVLDGPRVVETLTALHAMGIRLALDDFGTGQSSLSLLRAFPVDVVKLDKSFVDGIDTDDADRGRLAVATAVAQLADSLGLRAVAEGIETGAQLDRLREMGYRYGQGYLLAKPLAADEAGALMARPVNVDRAGAVQPRVRT